ncbi:MAG: ankyrin repeat domain-containing protein, partial [Bacteroidetes bacterium]|nr:ankyrin repeat domain-containing protein [Bacteroidota bacterium]
TIVFMLLQAGANPNQITHDEVTPLSMAAINGSYESAYLLLDAGANPDKSDKLGFTPLMLAAHEWLYTRCQSYSLITRQM